MRFSLPTQDALRQRVAFWIPSLDGYLLHVLLKLLAWMS